MKMPVAPRIVNVINFIRAVEPRHSVDLVEPVIRQMECLNRHQLPATWLLQYDALTQGPYVELLKSGLGPDHEIGAWFEVVQPLVERAGLKWCGRHPWDWHSHVGFSVGYTPTARERLADVFMAEFKAVFGRYPASVGSWFMDAHLLGYLHDRYGLVASCNCKDQWGTDGYSLWGGYWNQAYYPSRINAFMPAQHENAQIPVPVFRMLGSDPIYQYDGALNDDSNCAEVKSQGVMSLEPVYRRGGGNPDWVRWFFKSMSEAPCLSFAYAQVGQENSFGWKKMAVGFADQIEFLAGLRASGKLRVETLETSGRWFRRLFPSTPATAVTALEDHRQEDRKSVWYQSRFYRINLYWVGDRFRVRDIHKFDERYAERYLKTVCPGTASLYDTLPVVEGFLWSDREVISGLVPVIADADGLVSAMRGGDPVVEEPGADRLRVRWPLNMGGDLSVECSEDRVSWLCRSDAWRLELRWGAGSEAPFRAVGGSRIACQHNTHDYDVVCDCGLVDLDIDGRRLCLRPVGGRVSVSFA